MLHAHTRQFPDLACTVRALACGYTQVLEINASAQDLTAKMEVAKRSSIATCSYIAVLRLTELLPTSLKNLVHECVRDRECEYSRLDGKNAKN